MKVIISTTRPRQNTGYYIAPGNAQDLEIGNFIISIGNHVHNKEPFYIVPILNKSERAQQKLIDEQHKKFVAKIMEDFKTG